MHRYFLHLRHPAKELLAPEGVLLPEETVAHVTLEAARDCMAHSLRSGRLALNYRIDVHNEEGEVIRTLRFADAVTIEHAEEAPPSASSTWPASPRCKEPPGCHPTTLRTLGA